MKIGKIRTAAALALPFLLLLTGLYSGAIPSRLSSYDYHSSSPSAAPEGLRFEERKNIFPGIADQDPAAFGPFSRRMPGGAIACDLNGDDYDDVVAVYNTPTEMGRVRVFENEKGRSFRDVTEAWGLQMRPGITTVGCGDFHNDGRLDIAAAGIAVPVLVFRNEGNGFRIESSIPAYDETRSLALFDADGDGFLDIYLGNYRFLAPGDKNAVMSYRQGRLGVNQIMNRDGGVDRVYLNNSGRGNFRLLPEANTPDRGVTWAVGVADFNRDGMLDLFLAQDFGQDQILFGAGNVQFKDVSKSALGLPLRSRFSMSAAITDINEDGLPDVYVSNRPKSGLRRGYNSLWLSDSSAPGKFTDGAGPAGVDACGWSWGSLFGDLDQDGYTDLVVVNGLYGAGQSGYWYAADFLTGIPESLKETRGLTAGYSPYASISVEQDKCMFLGGPGGKFRDVALDSGFQDRRTSRAAIALDFDQDGDLDLLTGNPYDGPVLFENKMEKRGSWLTVRLRGTLSNAGAIGASVTLNTGAREIRRDHFPTNGYQSQSPGEIYFTLRPGESAEKLEVIWPGGRKTEIRNVELNRRIVLTEPR